MLRSENGCPWDREQTHESIRMNFLEEVYEACDAIDNKNDDNLKEELGDVLMQVVFHSRIAEEAGKYNFDEKTFTLSSNDRSYTLGQSVTVRVLGVDIGELFAGASLPHF